MVVVGEGEGEGYGEQGEQQQKMSLLGPEVRKEEEEAGVGEAGGCLLTKEELVPAIGSMGEAGAISQNASGEKLGDDLQKEAGIEVAR